MPTSGLPATHPKGMEMTIFNEQTELTHDKCGLLRLSVNFSKKPSRWKHPSSERPEAVIIFTHRA